MYMCSITAIHVHVHPPGEYWKEREPTALLLSHIKYIDSEGQEQHFRLIREIQADCKQLGLHLGVDSGTLKGLDKQHRGIMEDFCADVLEIWKVRARGYYPVTWGGLLDALEDADLKIIAKKLQKALVLFYNN